jgi:hypothetical protein
MFISSFIFARPEREEGICDGTRPNYSAKLYPVKFQGRNRNLEIESQGEETEVDPGFSHGHVNHE